MGKLRNTIHQGSSKQSASHYSSFKEHHLDLNKGQIETSEPKFPHYYHGEQQACSEVI